MCNLIITQNSGSALMPNRSFHRPDSNEFSADLLTCPQCHGLVNFSSVTRGAVCFTCGWATTLAADEAYDLTDALLGLNPDLRLDTFLQHVGGIAA